MQAYSDIPPLPDDAELRDKLATIISTIGRCDRQALLDGQSFATVMSDFDSILVLEILLEIETEFHITTDDMLPTDGAYQPQEITNAFPQDLTALMAYMRAVVVRVAAEREAKKQAQAEAAAAALAAAPAAPAAPAASAAPAAPATPATPATAPAAPAAAPAAPPPADKGSDHAT